MNKETKKIDTRDVREEMILDDYSGPLYIPEKYKREGFHYHVADSTRPGWIDYLQRIGYSIVHDETLQLGHSGVSNAHSIDSAVRVHLGGSKEALGILMETPLDLYNKRKAREAERAGEQLKALGHTGIPTQTGEITIGNEKFN